MIARADLSTDTFKSDGERVWFWCSEDWLAQNCGLDVSLTLYEPIKFHVGGGWYTPDFLHILKDGRHVFAEVKESKHQRSYRASRTKLKSAAALYPFYFFVEIVVNSRKEEITSIEWIDKSPVEERENEERG